MITFIIGVALLIAGYFLYKIFAEHFFSTSAVAQMPLKRMADGVDYQEFRPGLFVWCHF